MARAAALHRPRPRARRCPPAPLTPCTGAAGGGARARPAPLERRRAGGRAAGGGGRWAPSLEDAAQQNAEQNGLFGNGQQNANPFGRLFGQQTPNGWRFCSEPLLPSLVGGPCMCQDLVCATAESDRLTKKDENDHT